MAVRVQKEQQVQTLREELARTPHALLVDFRGLTVAAAADLRRRLRQQNARFRVVKNRVAVRALADTPLAPLREAFRGQTAIAYTDADVVRLARTLRDFAREFEAPRFKAGMVDGEPITAEQFEALADLPSREELVARALWLMQYPATGLVTALQGVLRNLVGVLDQIRRQKEAHGAPGG